MSRSEPWDKGIEVIKEADDREPIFAADDDEVPFEFTDREKVKHGQVRTVSIIRGELWESAKWNATAFVGTFDNSEPPTLAPVFENAESAHEIFAQWKNHIGVRDETDRIRVSIVRGVMADAPFAYRVVIGSNLPSELRRSTISYLASVSRINTMNPLSLENLDRFIEGYRVNGSYFLTAALGGPNVGGIQLLRDVQLLKHEIHIRQAWEIGRHDPDGVAILESDSPIIPKEVKDAPVVKLLEWKRQRRNSS